MTVYQAMAMARPMFEALIEKGVNLKDAQFLDLYADYLRMRDEGEKVVYIETILCEKYGIKRAKFYLIIKSFQEELEIGA